VLTTHTVHIAILPESSQLTAPDTGPMKLKYYTLGPITHVTSQSGIVSALWHPLGVNGSCLVTVTEDAVVRVWELSIADRWSFDRPTLAIDLKKLADGTSVDQDFGVSVQTNNAFSPDSFEMEVASACFAGRGSGGWSPMTLWVAMREGDVYALCPLLPEKWSPPPTLIPSLSVSIVAKVAAMEDDPTIPQKNKLLAQQQLAWMSDIDIQEPVHLETPGGGPLAEVYVRPSKPGRVPRLQGPFEFELSPEESEDELDSLLSDIYVIGQKIDADELMFGEEDDLEMDDIDQEGLSVGIICVLTSSGRLSICLDLDGVEAQWLPPKTKSKVLRTIEEVDFPSLLTFEVLDTIRDGEYRLKDGTKWKNNWPLISQDVNSRYSFYITDTSSVTFISLSPWVFRLQNELNEASAGTDFRIDLLVKGQNSIRERLYTEKPVDLTSPLAASTLIRDPDLGYFLLTATPWGPISLTFEEPEVHFDLRRSISRSPTFDPEPDAPLVLCETRPVYQPAHTLEQNSGLPAFLERMQQSKFKRIMKEEVRLSPATLTIMTEAHKVLSEETHGLATAAAELFRRCEQLQTDLKDQIKKANDVALRVESITGTDSDDGPVYTNNERVEQRIGKAQAKQKELTDRINAMKKKVARGTSQELSDKEKAWAEEVKILESKILPGGADQTEKKVKEPWARYEQAERLRDELLEQVKGISVDEETVASPNIKVPSEIRKTKMNQIMNLLDRESALVEAAKSRLERLSLSS
jgi:nucleoporin NUP82